MFSNLEANKCMKDMKKYNISAQYLRIIPARPKKQRDMGVSTRITSAKCCINPLIMVVISHSVSVNIYFLDVLETC